MNLNNESGYIAKSGAKVRLIYRNSNAIEGIDENDNRNRKSVIVTLINNFTIFDIDLDMDIQAEKLNLIQWLAGINEPSIIKQFIALKKEQQTDWWDQIDVEEKAEIEEGIAQADNGEFLAHDEVMAKYQKWRSK